MTATTKRIIREHGSNRHSLYGLDASPADCAHVREFVGAGEAVVSRPRVPLQGAPRRYAGERVRDHRVERHRRARRDLGRYARANRLRGMLVLTVAGPAPSRDDVKRRVSACLRQATRRRPFPWVVVLERGDGGRWHAHVLVRPADVFAVRNRWSHGMSRVRFGDDWTDYVSKGWSALPEGVRRYEPARGFAPVVVETEHDDYHAALDYLTERHGDASEVVEAPHRASDDPAWAVVRWHLPQRHAA